MGRPREKWLKGSHGLGTQSALRTLGRNEWCQAWAECARSYHRDRLILSGIRCEAASSSLSEITQPPRVPAALALPCPLGSPAAVCFGKQSVIIVHPFL